MNHLLPTRRRRLLGVPVDMLCMSDLLAQARQSISTRKRTIITHQNLHGVYLFHRDQAMRDLQEEHLVHIDGMPLVFWGRCLGYPLRREHRVTWVDWLPVLIGVAAVEQWRVFYLGAAPGVAERAAVLLRQRYARLLLDTHHGHFGAIDGKSSRQVADAINAARPDLLLVGMGMPRQERWVLVQAARLDVPVIMTCGAAIEYMAGSMSTPPRWMGRVGLEWLYRLSSEPHRLWRRYLLEPWALLPWAVRDVGRKFTERRVS